MSEEDFETLGRMVDRMDNLSAASVIPLPNELRITALNEAIRSMRDELHAFLIEHGFDPWDA
jgi:hypothetical protein